MSYLWTSFHTRRIDRKAKPKPELYGAPGDTEFHGPLVKGLGFSIEGNGCSTFHGRKIQWKTGQHTPFNEMPGNPKLFRPNVKTLCSAIKRRLSGVFPYASVVRLFVYCLPLYIVGFVITIIVLASNRVPWRWSRTNISIKVFEGVPPALTDSYPAKHIMFGVFPVWVIATLIHALPYFIFWNSRKSVVDFFSHKLNSILVLVRTGRKHQLTASLPIFRMI
jgi:hypothetical protein